MWGFSRYFQILSKPKVSGILLIFRGDVFELSPRPNSFALYQKCCKAFSKCVLRKIQWHPIEIILRYFQVVSQPNFGWILLKLLLDVFELSPSPNSFAWYQKFCEALPKCVLGEFQLHPIEYYCKTFSNCFSAKLNCILLKLFEDFPKCDLAEIQLHRAENIVRQFQICLSWSSIASYRNCFQTFS